MVFSREFVHFSEISVLLNPLSKLLSIPFAVVVRNKLLQSYLNLTFLITFLVRQFLDLVIKQ